MNRGVVPLLLLVATVAAFGCASRTHAALPPLAMPWPESRLPPGTHDQAREPADRKPSDLSDRMRQSNARRPSAAETARPTSAMGNVAAAPAPTSTAGTVVVTTPGPPARDGGTVPLTPPPDEPAAATQERHLAIPIAIALGLIGAIVWLPRWTDRAIDRDAR